MTYQHKLTVLSSTAGVLAVAIILSFIFSPEAIQSRASKATIISQRTADKTAQISISAGGSVLQLKKAGSAWTMDKDGKTFPASSDKVDSFLKALSSAEGLSKVSSKKSDWSSFGLDGSDAKKVTFADLSGKQLQQLVIGSAAGTGKEVYLSFGESGAVYRAKNSFDSYLRTDDRSWGDLRLLPATLKVEGVQGLSVVSTIPSREGESALSGSYQLSRDAKKGWKVTGDDAKALDRAKVDAFVDGLVGIQGDSFAAATDAPAPTQSPEFTFSLQTGKGEQFQVQAFYREATKDYLLKASGSEQLYVLSEWALRTRDKLVSELEAQAPAPKAQAKK